MITFEKYHNENPLIWEKFKELSFEAKAKGFKNYSANGIFELIRWHTKFERKDPYKLNNNYRPDYARKMMDEFPEFKDFFRIRGLSASRIDLKDCRIEKQIK